MKRRLAIILVCLTVFMLCGCCLSHEWQEATCTEPKTCSKCGKQILLFSDATNRCPICKKVFCDECFAQEGIYLNIEDFEYQCICLDCYPKVEKLVEKAKTTEFKFNMAQYNHEKACDKLLQKIKQEADKVNEQC